MTLNGIVHFWLTATNYGSLHQEWLNVAKPKLGDFWGQVLAPLIYNFRRLGTTPKEDFIR